MYLCTLINRGRVPQNLIMIMSVKLDYKDTVKKKNLLLGCSSRCSLKRDGKYQKIGTYNQTQTQQLST
jgi:hypothetical protein